MELRKINCPLEKGAPLMLNNSHGFSTRLEADEEGFYDVVFNYFHEDWDNWLIVTVYYPDGGKLEYTPCFPHGRMQKDVQLYLKKGFNTLVITHRFGHEFRLFDISIKGKVDKKSSISPLHQTQILGDEKAHNILLKSYCGELLRIEADGLEIGFIQKDIPEMRSYEGFRRHQKSIALDREDIGKLGLGNHTLKLYLSSGEVLEQTLSIIPKAEYKLEVVNFNAGCSNSTLLRLPNGKYLMIDSSTDKNCENIIKPYLKKHGIKLDYYLLTHFHEDHWGLMDELMADSGIKKPDAKMANALISEDNEKRLAYLKQFGYLDSTMLKFYDELGDIWDLGGVRITVLNSRYDKNGNPMKIHNIEYVKYNEHNFENSTSVSLFIKYNGFGYYHGADNYAFSQTRLMEDYKRMGKDDELPCHYYYANHHFHCDIDTRFIKTVNPVLVYASVDVSAYSRSTYAHDYIEEVENYFFSHKRLAETLLSFEVGTALLHINSGEDWCYETKLNADL